MPIAFFKILFHIIVACIKDWCCIGVWFQQFIYHIPWSFNFYLLMSCSRRKICAGMIMIWESFFWWLILKWAWKDTYGTVALKVQWINQQLFCKMSAVPCLQTPLFIFTFLHTVMPTGSKYKNILLTLVLTDILKEWCKCNSNGN